MIVRLPEDTHWWFASRTRALQALLDTAAVPSNPEPPRVLDIGCGAGNMTHHLEQYGQVVGFDPHAGALKVAVARGCTVLQSDASALPFGDGTFDLVAALDVIEHCQDDFAVLSEIQRVLKPGGLLAVTVPAFEWLWSYNDVLNRHYRRYTAEQLRERVEEAGFTVKRLGYNNFFVFPLAAAVIVARGKTPARKLSAPVTDGAYQVEMEPTAAPINAVLDTVGRIEAKVIRRRDLPIGTGILCIAERLP